MKNIDYAIRKTIIDLNVPDSKIDETKKIILKYWKEVYDKMMVMKMEDDKSTLFLRSIGIFTISKFKLNKFILRTIGKMKGIIKSPKYSDAVKERQKKKLLAKLKKALIHRNLLAIYYYKYYKK